MIEVVLAKIGCPWCEHVTTVTIHQSPGHSNRITEMCSACRRSFSMKVQLTVDLKKVGGNDPSYPAK